MNGRYVVIGIVLTGLLVGVVVAAKKIRPTASMHRIAADDFKTKGPSEAPVQIVEYSDFQCPACNFVQAPLKQVMETYPGKIQLMFRHYPLPGHQWAGIAHQSAECAGREGGFWDFHDKLYAEQANWSKSANPTEVFVSYAKNLGFNLETFGACLMDQSVRDKILAEKSKGDSLKVTATPTLFINGERIVGPAEFKARGENTVRKALGLPPIEVPPQQPLAPAP